MSLTDRQTGIIIIIMIIIFNNNNNSNNDIVNKQFLKLHFVFLNSSYIKKNESFN